MTYIIALFWIWAASALIRHIVDKRARARAEREAQIEAQRRATEQERLRRDLREMKQRADAEIAARIALDREQMRQRREQEKLFAEQAKERKEREAADAKLAKEQEKLAKRVEALEYKMRQLDRNIKAQNELLADYYAQLDSLLLEQSGMIPGSKSFNSKQNQIVTKNNQIRKAECKLADMKDAKERAAKELAA